MHLDERKKAMHFSEGDRVTPIGEETIYAVGENNIGTITKIYYTWNNEDIEFLEINWDNKGVQTYPEGINTNQWNVSTNSVKVIGQSEFKEISGKYYPVCKKILQLKNKRKRLGYVF